MYKKRKQRKTTDYIEIRNVIKETAKMTWLTQTKVEDMLEYYTNSEIRRWCFINWEYVCADFIETINEKRKRWTLDIIN